MSEEIETDPSYLHFVNSLDMIHHLLREADTLPKTMQDVLDSILSVFECDRVFLMYPCDPEAAAWRLPMERSRTEFHRLWNPEQRVPMNQTTADSLRCLLSSEDPVIFGPDPPFPLPKEVQGDSGFRYFMSMALHPRTGKPWQLGICSRSRSWTTDDSKLFREIGRRLGDALSGMLLEQSLQEREEGYCMVFENSPLPIWEEDFSRVKELFDELKDKGVDDLACYLDQHPEIVHRCAELVTVADVNRAAQALHAAETKEQLISYLTDLFTPESFATFQKELICLWNGETEMNEDSVVKTLAGECRNVSLYFSVCPEYEKTFSKVLVSLIDITERKRAEKALQASEALLNTSQHISKVGGWEYNIQSGRSFWSEELYRIHELPSNSAIDHVHASLNCFSPKDRPIIQDAFRKACEQGEPYDFELPFTTYKGTQLWIRTTAQPVYENGKVTRVVGNLMDITDRKQAEESLRQNEHLLKTLINSTPDIICFKDGQGRWLQANDSDLELFGLKNVDYRGKTDAELAEFTDPIYRQAFLTCESTDEKAWQADGISHGEEVIPKPDGSHKVFDTIKIPLFETDGSRKGLVVLGRDITDSKRLEEQLRQSQKLEAVGQLAGGVAHDFNNMLIVILGNIEMALMDISRKSPIHPLLLEVDSAAKRATALTRQLLAFARKQAIAPRILNLNDTVSGMLKMLRRLIGEDIELTWLPEEKLWPVKMDPGQLDQILANLCINARDAISSHGKVTIETHNKTLDQAYSDTHMECSPGDYVLLTVSDNGCGMDEETISRIFEPFFTTKGLGRGTGLGLATAYGIVKQNNGFINVRSKPGHGTAFDIYFPRNQSAPVVQSKKNRGPEPQGNGETILLVEDETSVLNLGKRMLNELGYEPLPAPTPEEAIRLAEQQGENIQLVITDVIMPKMNGRELADKLATMIPEIKCLFISGYTGNVIDQQEILDKDIHFIQKPFSRQELAAKVREILDSD